MNRNLDDTRRFIRILTGDENTPMTWQALPDKVDKKDLRQILHGPLCKLATQLEILNEHGAGIFVTINETDLKGRKTENIKRVRALFADSDNGPIKQCPLSPTMKINSARGQHAYWIVGNNEPKDKFSKAQKRIAEGLGTDPSISDLSRVMRAPGFMHLRLDPFLVSIAEVSESARPYTIEEVVSQFGEPRKLGSKYGLAALESTIGKVVSQPEGGRHKAIFSAAAAMGELVAGGELEKDHALAALVRAAKIAATNGEREISAKEIEKVINDGIARGTLNPRKAKYSDNTEPAQGDDLSEKQDRPKKPKAPHVADMALALLGDHTLCRDHYDNTYKYNGRFWEPISTNQLKHLAGRYDGRYTTTDRRRSETISYALIQDDVQQNKIQWNKISESEIPLAAGVLDVLTGKLRDHDKNDWIDKAVDVDFHTDATCPLWDECLSVWFGEDPEMGEKIYALQEFFGYLLLNHAKYKKALILYGPSDCGKSQVAGLMRAMVGSNNCCQIAVEKMSDPRSIAPIKGKMLNMITELPDEALVADGGFKQLVSTGEPVELDQKYAQPEMYVPTCKHVIACNALPSINDKTSATYNRLLVIQFNRSVPKQEQDRDLLLKLQNELPGILNWACRGAQRLTKNRGWFTDIAESEAILQEHSIEQNPVRMFLDERFEMSDRPGARVEFRTFVRDFNDWTGGHALAPRTIGRALSAMRLRRDSIHGVRYVLGIEYKN